MHGTGLVALVSADNPVPQPTYLGLSWGGLTAWTIYVITFLVFLGIWIFSKQGTPRRAHAAWATVTMVVVFLLLGVIMGVVLPWLRSQ